MGSSPLDTPYSQRLQIVRNKGPLYQGPIKISNDFFDVNQPQVCASSLLANSDHMTSYFEIEAELGISIT